ncbi:hypothetical protein A2U01_0110050, partial [Trifolium medium]|nr:hypothetical protein [Trifolium medium]
VTTSWNDIVAMPQAMPLQHHDPTTNLQMNDPMSQFGFPLWTVYLWNRDSG